VVSGSTSFSYSHCLLNRKMTPYGIFTLICGDFGENYNNWRVPSLALMLPQHSVSLVSCSYSLWLFTQPLCSQIIHRDHVPNLDFAISDLVAEEIRLHSLSTLASTPTCESETVLAVIPWSFSSRGPRSNTHRQTLLYHLQE